MCSTALLTRVRRAFRFVAVFATGALSAVVIVAPAASAADAAFLGSAGGLALRAPIVAMAPTPSGAGYWMVASDGGIFTFGDAPFLGSLGSLHLNAPIVGLAPTPSGRGYWMVASDGGIFTFGDAPFLGSLGSLKLDRPIVSMASTASDRGYWMVASDGGIFTFGDAPFLGSLGSLKLDQPIVSMSVTPDRHGYWLGASDGGVFTFGDAPFMGSLGYLKLVRPVVGLIASPTGAGYWMAASDGGVFNLDGTSPGAPNPTLFGGGTVGPSDPAALHTVGPLTITTPNAVVTNVDVQGQLTIDANNVTVKNFRAFNVIQNAEHTGMILEDGEVSGNNSTDNSTDGIGWSDYTAIRLNVHNQFDGLKAMGNVLIENCWVHDNNFKTGDPAYGAGGYTHNDGVQISTGSNITIRDSRFERNLGNSAIFIDADQGPIDHVTVTGNYLGGGGLTLYSIRSRSAPQYRVPTNVAVTNNVFSEEHAYDYATIGGAVIWSGNVNLNGQTVVPRLDPLSN